MLVFYPGRWPGFGLFWGEQVPCKKMPVCLRPFRLKDGTVLANTGGGTVIVLLHTRLGLKAAINPLRANIPRNATTPLGMHMLACLIAYTHTTPENPQTIVSVAIWSKERHLAKLFLHSKILLAYLLEAHAAAGHMFTNNSLALVQ